MGARRVLPSIRLQRAIALADDVHALRVRAEAGLDEALKAVQVSIPKIPDLPRRFVPLRERSLHSVVVRRSLRVRRTCRRWGRI